MIIIDPKNDKRRSDTDDLRIQANYTFAKYLEEYLGLYNESCKLTRSAIDAPTVRLKSLVTNYTPEVTFIIDCYNDANPKTYGFLVKADAYSALVETIVHEMSQLGLKPIVELGYDDKLTLQYGSVADIEIYLGFASNTKLPDDPNKQTDEEIVVERDVKVATAESDAEVAKNKLSDLELELSTAVFNVSKAQEAKNEADRLVEGDNESTPSATVTEHLVKAAEAEQELIRCNNIVTELHLNIDEAQKEYDKCLEAVKEAESYTGDPYTPPVTQTDADRLADADFLSLVARRIVEGSYGPPIKTLQELDEVGISDPYFYTISDWQPTDSRDPVAAECINETSLQGSRVRYLTVTSTFGDSEWRTPTYTPEELESLDIIIPAGTTEVTRHCSYAIDTVYTKETACYLILSARTLAPVTLYFRVGKKELTHKLTSTEFTTVIKEFTVPKGSKLEIGILGEGSADFTGVWLSPSNHVGTIDDPRSLYNILPAGYRSAVTITTSTTGSNPLEKAITTADTLIDRAKDKPTAEEKEEESINTAGTVKTSSSSGSSSLEKFASMALAATCFSKALSGLVNSLGNNNPLKATLQNLDNTVKDMEGLTEALQEQAANTIDGAEKAALLQAKNLLNGMTNAVKEAKQRPTAVEEEAKKAEAKAKEITDNLNKSIAKIKGIADKQVSENVDNLFKGANKDALKTDASGNVTNVGGKDISLPDDLKITAETKPEDVTKLKEKQKAYVKKLAQEGTIEVPNTLSKETLDKYTKQVDTIQAKTEKVNKSLKDAQAKQEEQIKKQKADNKDINKCSGAVQSKAEEATELAKKVKDKLNEASSKLANIKVDKIESTQGNALSAIKDLKNSVDTNISAAKAVKSVAESAVSKPLSVVDVQKTYEAAVKSVASAVDVTVGSLSKTIGSASSAKKATTETLKNTVNKDDKK